MGIPWEFPMRNSPWDLIGAPRWIQFGSPLEYTFSPLLSRRPPQNNCLKRVFKMDFRAYIKNLPFRIEIASQGPSGLISAFWRPELHVDRTFTATYSERSRTLLRISTFPQDSTTRTPLAKSCWRKITMGPLGLAVN